MAHKTLIGGTAYEISGGKTLVDGTAYSIKNGKTMVDGTVYEVGFGEMVTVTIDITSVYRTSCQSITVDGVTYNTVGKTVLSVPVGTEIVCKVDATECDCGDKFAYSYVYLNDSEVVFAYSTSSNKSYTYIVVGNVTISSVGTKSSSCKDCAKEGDDEYGYGATITITEE